MDKDMTVYIRPYGSHYHTSKACPMLQGSDYERLGYYPIKLSELKRKNRGRKIKYWLCACGHPKRIPKLPKVGSPLP